MALLRNALLTLMVFTACGDPLVDETYSGPVQILLRGNPEGTDFSTIAAEHDFIRGSLFCLKSLEAVPSDATLTEQTSTSTALRMPWSFEWPIYDVPQAPHLFTTSTGKRLGVALMVLYADANSNRQHDPGENFVGHSRASVLLFNETDFEPGDSTLGRTMSRGYHIVSTPLLCKGPPPPPMDAETDCGPRLGERCTTASDCGAGSRCMKDEGWPWPEGTCVWPAKPGSCHPRNSTVWTLPQKPPAMPERLWVRACKSDSDCRGEPYQCDVAQGACLPSLTVPITIEKNAGYASLCPMMPMP